MIGFASIIIAIIAIGYLIVKSHVNQKRKEHLARLDISAKDIAKCQNGTNLQKIILQRLYQKASLIFWRIYNNFLVLFPNADESTKNALELFKKISDELRDIDYDAIINENQKMEKISLEIEIPSPKTPREEESSIKILEDADELRELTTISMILLGNNNFFDIGIKIKIIK